MKTNDNTNDILAVADAMPADFSTRARLHYAKAVRKHPRFADALFMLDENDKRKASNALPAAIGFLDEARKDNVLDDERGTLMARYLLGCEFREAFVAHLKGDKSACVDELYDAVAVLMRMIAVVEGKQKLGGEK